jgi:hypothetical protein
MPFHHKSQFLGERDLFGDMAAAAKQRGIRVVARMDCNYAYEEALKAHPKWFERGKDGSPRRHPECPWLYKTCQFIGYFTEQMPAIYREINKLYPVDGFFTNAGPAPGRSASATATPAARSTATRWAACPRSRPTRPASCTASTTMYLARVLEVWRQWDTVAREKSPQNVYVGNLGDGLRTVKSLKRLAEVASWFNADHQGRAGDTVIWDCAQQGRVARAVMQGRTVTNVTGAYSNSRPVWRHAAKPAAEMTLWLAQTTASGMVPWLH